MGIVMNILHVVTAVFIIGPMAILPMTGMRAIKAGQGGQVMVLAKSTFLFTLLSLLVVLFGFGITGIYGIPTTTPWILISIVLYAIALILNLVVVVPAMRRAAHRLTGTGNGAPAPVVTTGATDGAVTDTGSSRAAAAVPAGSARAATPAAQAAPGNEYTLVAMGSGISSILLLVVVILMVWKP